MTEFLKRKYLCIKFVSATGLSVDPISIREGLFGFI